MKVTLLSFLPKTFLLFLSLSRHYQITTALMSSASSSNNQCDDRLQLWHQKWNNQQIGWHENDVHDAIRLYENTLLFPSLKKNENDNNSNPTPPLRVLFPLCGKTIDMAYLATKYPTQLQIVGIDGVSKALETFVQEQQHLIPMKQIQDQAKWKSSNLELVQSDFFHVPKEYYNSFDIIFDRASLVAISPTLREDYVQVCHSLLKPKGKIMLVVIERITGDTTIGPPYSVTHDDIERLYTNQEWVESVQLLEDPMDEEKRTQVSTDMVSKNYWIQCK